MLGIERRHSKSGSVDCTKYRTSLLARENSAGWRDSGLVDVFRWSNGEGHPLFTSDGFGFPSRHVTMTSECWPLPCHSRAYVLPPVYSSDNGPPGLQSNILKGNYPLATICVDLHFGAMKPSGKSGGMPLELEEPYLRPLDSSMERDH